VPKRKLLPRYDVPAICLFCRSGFVAKRYHRPVASPFVSTCRDCYRDIYQSRTQLKKLPAREWLERLERVRPDIRAHVASVVFWEFGFIPWLDFVDRFPFMAKDDAAPEDEVLKALVQIGFSLRHAQYKVLKKAYEGEEDDAEEGHHE